MLIISATLIETLAEMLHFSSDLPRVAGFVQEPVRRVTRSNFDSTKESRPLFSLALVLPFPEDILFIFSAIYSYYIRRRGPFRSAVDQKPSGSDGEVKNSDFVVFSPSTYGYSVLFLAGLEIEHSVRVRNEFSSSCKRLFFSHLLLIDLYMVLFKENGLNTSNIARICNIRMLSILKEPFSNLNAP